MLAGTSVLFLWKTQRQAAGNLQVDTSKALAGQAGIRGPYTNTGSRDAGPDPDFKPGHFLVVSSLSVRLLAFCKSTQRAPSAFLGYQPVQRHGQSGLPNNCTALHCV